MRGERDGHARAFLRIALASAAVEEGDYETAASQLEESLTLCREQAGPGGEVVGAAEALREQLGMSPERAIEYAISEE